MTATKLVIGASGFLGSHVTRRLVERGGNVRVLMRPTSSTRGIDDLLDRVEVHRGDIFDAESVRAAADGCDTVYYCVVDARAWLRDPAPLWRTNVDGLRNVLDVMTEPGVASRLRRFVFTSSIATIGIPESGPATEDLENNWLDRGGEYVRSRVRAEQLVLRYHKDRRLPAVAMCVSNTYGPGDWVPTPHGGLVAAAVRGRMPFYIDGADAEVVGVTDAAEALVLAGERGTSGERYIVSERMMSAREIYGIACGAVGVEPPRRGVRIRVISAAAGVSDVIARLRKRETRLSPLTVRLMRVMPAMDHGKAARELGWEPAPTPAAIAEAAYMTASSVAITPEQHELTEAFSRFAAHHALVSETRSNLDALADGRLPAWWPELVDNGFHVVHVPEHLGGQGGGLADMACVLHAAGAALLPGPLLNSSVVAAVLSENEAAQVLLKEIAAGTPAVVVLPHHSDVTARPAGAGWQLTGSTGVMPGILSAQRVVLPFHDDRNVLRWTAIDTTGCEVEPRTGTDLTTDLGVLHLHDHTVSDAALLPGVDVEHVVNVTVAFTATVVAGITQWCVRTVTEHLRTREQFGKPIGAFQALQHKAAMLLVNSELATAAAWDAVRALSISDDPVQHRIAAASAAVRAVAPAPGLVLEALTMLGAIGFTWEHDLHLYWRRATSLAASLGPVSRWTRELGERSTPRELRVDLGPEADTTDSAFRGQVAEVLDRVLALPEDTGGDDAPQGHGREFVTGARRDLLAEAGLIAPHWPVPWGCDATVRQQLIVDEEFARRPGLIRPSVGIAEWILPTIISAGTEDLRRRFIPATLRGELAWCQLFSEPGAGSDLASLSTRAVRVDGGWRITGHKIWTSSAHRADYGALLARTDPEAPKHRGIGYFIVDMRSPGIELCQITQASGRSEFNEVFLTDVFIPDDMLLGEPTSGWQLAISTMAHERVAISGYVHIDRMGALRELAATATCERDPLLHAIGEIDAYTNALKALGLRETLRLLDGQPPGPTSSIAKVATNVMLRRAAELTLGLAGRVALEQSSAPAVVVPYLDLPAELIGGGTTEIQLNIIAQMILGLPRK